MIGMENPPTPPQKKTLLKQYHRVYLLTFAMEGLACSFWEYPRTERGPERQLVMAAGLIKKWFKIRFFFGLDHLMLPVRLISDSGHSYGSAKDMADSSACPI